MPASAPRRSDAPPTNPQNPAASAPTPPLFHYEPLVDRTVLADSLPQLLGGLLVRPLIRTPGRTRHDVGPDTPRFPVIVGDLGVHGGQAPLGLLVGLAGVGDEVTFAQDVGDGPVSHLYRPLRIIDEDPLDLLPLLLVATPALFRERLKLPLHATATLPEFPLGLLLGTPLLCRPFVLRAELLPTPLALLFAPLRGPPPRREVQRRQHDHDNHHDDHDQGRSVHVLSSRSFSWLALFPEM